MTEEIALEERLLEVLASTEAIREEIVKENIKRDKRITWSRRAIVAVLAVAVIAVGVAAFAEKDANQSSKDARHAASALAVSKQQTTKARESSCLQANIAQKKNIATQVRLSHDLVTGLLGPNPDAERVAAAVVYNKAHDKLIHDGYEIRDCSPEGIAIFLGQTKTP